MHNSFYVNLMTKNRKSDGLTWLLRTEIFQVDVNLLFQSKLQVVNLHLQREVKSEETAGHCLIALSLMKGQLQNSLFHFSSCLS